MRFHVNPDLCLKCGSCISDCVCQIISLDQNGLPQVAPDLEARCVSCGHCMAICPMGAVSLDGLSASELEPAPGPVARADMAALLKGRRAARKFGCQPVSRNDLEQAFSCADYAPTAHNARQVGYIVLEGFDKVAGLARETVDIMERFGLYPALCQKAHAGEDPILRKAACVILVHAPLRFLSETDCATAAAYLELALHGLGLASCWAGMFIEACSHALPASIQLPEGHRLYAALMVGTPALHHPRLPYRSPVRVDWK